MPLFNVNAEQAFKKLPVKLQTFFTRYPPAPIRGYAEKQTLATAPDANPFLPNIHPVTKKVQDPIYSLRRQADLYKLAYKFGVADLMPKMQNGKLLYDEKYAKKPLLKGLVNPKGHKWERTYDERRQKLEDGIAKADEVLVEHRGAKYKKRLERRKTEQRTWY